jgi:hypothetical protein
MRKSQTGQFSMSAQCDELALSRQHVEERDVPSSRITLSPNTVISNLPVARRRERMLRMGRERALRSMAATPGGQDPCQLVRLRFLPSLLKLAASPPVSERKRDAPNLIKCSFGVEGAVTSGVDILRLYWWGGSGTGGRE